MSGIIKYLAVLGMHEKDVTRNQIVHAIEVYDKAKNNGGGAYNGVILTGTKTEHRTAASLDEVVKMDLGGTLQKVHPLERCQDDHTLCYVGYRDCDNNQHRALIDIIPQDKNIRYNVVTTDNYIHNEILFMRRHLEKAGILISDEVPATNTVANIYNVLKRYYNCDKLTFVVDPTQLGGVIKIVLPNYERIFGHMKHVEFEKPDKSPRESTVYGTAYGRVKRLGYMITLGRINPFATEFIRFMANPPRVMRALTKKKNQTLLRVG